MCALELVMANVVLVFADGDQFDLDAEGLQSVLRPPLSAGPTANGQFLVSSARDQIEVQLSARRLEIRDMRGDPDHVHESIPKRLDWFVEKYYGESTLQSYGVNFIMEAPQADPQMWLATNILKEGLGSTIGALVGSNNASLIFVREPKRWTIKLEARIVPEDMKRIHIDSNSSENTAERPNHGKLAEEIPYEYKALIQALDQLGLGHE